MPTSTPNIGLTLPIGTEKVSRAIINQNMTKIDTAFGNMTRATMRPVPFDVAVSDWSGSGSSWTATFVTAFVTSTSQEILTYTSSIKTAKAEDLDAMKQPGGGGIVFTSTKKPIGTISGTIYVWDTDDGKIPVIIEGTVTPIENGGTNASNLTGAKQNLGISALETNVQNLSEQIGALPGAIKSDLHYFIINGTSLSSIESQLTTLCSSMGASSIKIGILHANYSQSMTGGSRCIAIAVKLDTDLYKVEVLGTWKEGYYYSNAWHWS